jgi:hypothetical protein
MLTPKFGTGESLIGGPNLVKNLVWRGNISSEDSAKELAVDSLLPFGKGLFALISRDCVVTWPDRKGQMDG